MPISEISLPLYKVVVKTVCSRYSSKTCCCLALKCFFFAPQAYLTGSFSFFFPCCCVNVSIWWCFKNCSLVKAVHPDSCISLYLHCFLPKMLRHFGAGIIVPLVYTLVLILSGMANANDCNIGFLSSGCEYLSNVFLHVNLDSLSLHDQLPLLGISPPGDLYIEEGQPWEMFCVLNTSHPDGQGGSWKNLSFYIDNKLVESPQVEKFNETAIRLYVPVSEVSSNGPPHDFYSVTCKQNQVTGICVRHVSVGCEFIMTSFCDVFQIVSS